MRLKELVTCLLIAIAPAVALNAGQLERAEPNDSQAPDRLYRKPLVSVLSPTEGEAFQGRSVGVLLDISSRANRRTVAVRLNGKDVTNRFRDSSPCLGVKDCTMSGVFSLRDGLRGGRNRLAVRASSRERAPEETRLEFQWKPSTDVDLTDPNAMQLSPSIAFTTLAPGGQQATGAPWVQIYSNALTGGTQTFPNASDTLCNSAYQVIQLDRKLLSEKSYSCYNDDATLQSALKAFPAGDLILVGTVFLHNAQSALNTTAIGGTDYTDSSKYPGFMYPEGYMIIGVAGANAGTAYENYVVSNDFGGFQMQLSGILTLNGNGYYDYHPSDNVTYSVDAEHSKITVNGVVYTPPTTLTNGFWLLKLRSWDLANEQGCSTPDGGSTYPGCGDALDTTTTEGMASLVTELSNANRRHLLFLVAVGSPFVSGTPPTQDLVNQIESLGGSGYTLDKMMDQTNPRYTIVSCSDPLFSKAAFGGSAVVSSSLAYQQTGSVLGVLTRNPHTMYAPISTIQDDVTAETHVDNSFYQIAWTQPKPWPLMDTPAHLGAYRYVSNAIGTQLKDETTIDDIRPFYYTSSNADLFSVDFSEITYPTGGTWLDPVDGNTYVFMQNDFNAVSSQIHREIKDIQTITNYMYVANGGLKDALLGSTSGAVFDLIAAASSAATDLGMQTSSTNVSLNLSNASNLLGAIASVASIFLDPEDLPILGVTSGLLWGAGSSAILNPGSTAPTNPYLPIITTVENLANSQSTYITNMQKAFDTAMSDIFSDWNKLSVVATNTGLGGSWQISENSYTNFASVSKRSAQLYFYTQLFASVYSADVFPSQPTNVNKPWLIGGPRLDTECPYCFTYTCIAMYPSKSPDNTYIVYPTPADRTLNDIFYVGGALTQNGSEDMTEKYPSADYLNIMFGTDTSATSPPQLNLSSDQFWSPNGPLTRRWAGLNGPSLGWYCYNIGGATKPPK